jgi:HEAT repeat protein
VSTPSLWDLVDQLGDTDPRKREEAAQGIAEKGAAAKGAVPKLLEALRDPDENVRLYSARALGAIGPAAKDAIPILVAMTKENDYAFYCWSAGEALGLIGAEPSVCIPVYADLLGTMCGAPVEIVRAVGRMGKAGRELLPVLEAQMKGNGNPEMRAEAKLAREAILNACVE